MGGGLEGKTPVRGKQILRMLNYDKDSKSI